MVTKQTHDNLVSKLCDIKVEVLAAIKELVAEMGNYVEVPEDINDYCYNCIAYNGGNHPEYASNVFECVSAVSYDKNSDSVNVIFDNCSQDIEENCLDDQLVVLNLLLTIKEDYEQEEV